MKFNRIEQETVITFEAETGEWNFYTCVPTHIALFTQNDWITTKDIKVLTEYEGVPTSISFNAKNDLINSKQFIKKKRAKRELTEAQRQGLAKGREKMIANRSGDRE